MRLSLLASSSFQILNLHIINYCENPSTNLAECEAEILLSHSLMNDLDFVKIRIIPTGSNEANFLFLSAWNGFIVALAQRVFGREIIDRI